MLPGRATTPHRRTVLTFDAIEPILVETPGSMKRRGAEIARGNAEGTGSRNVHLMATGAWTLEPLHKRLDYIHERTDNAGAPLGLGDFLLAPGIVSQQQWRSPAADLFGVTVGANVASSGDNFLVKAVQAGVSWAQSLTADITSFGQPTQPSANVPVDRIGVGQTAYSVNQPYVWRFIVSSTRQSSPDVVATKYFGGPAASDGSGQYALTVTGSGMARLFEKNGSAWVYRALWRYCPPHRVCDTFHLISIHPHQDATGGRQWIEFKSTAAETGSPPAGFSLVSPWVPGGQSLDGTYVYPVRAVQQSTPGNAPPAVPTLQQRPYVTGVGVIRLDTRRDIRLKQQVSLMRFQTTGTLVDLPFNLTMLNSAGSLPQDLTLSWNATFPTVACTLVGKLYDATTGAELALVSTTDTTRVYVPNMDQVNYYATFTLGGDGTATPYLYSYTVVKDGLYANSPAPEWTLPLEAPDALAQVQLTSVSITDGERDPSHNTAMLVAEDFNGSLLTLNARSGLSTEISTQYDPDDDTLTSVLFRGRIARATATLKGMLGVSYPTADWRNYQISFIGAWQRLYEQPLTARIFLGPDPAAMPDPTTGAQVMYKVTDICRALISYAGYPAGMIDIPDSPIRFWPGANGAEDAVIEPLARIGELVVKFFREYLGWFLVWDGNAGDAGMWRGRPPTVAPYTNLAVFHTSPPKAGIPHMPQLYGSQNLVGTGSTPVKTFIRKKTLQTWVKPPEANAVFVCGMGETLQNNAGNLLITNYAINQDSIDNPSSPDYINGELIPLFIVDPALGSSIGGGQAAIDYFVRRYFQVSCYAIKMAAFEAPLVLVNDPNDMLQTQPRPLRYYDAVQINSRGSVGQWLVRNCNPDYKKDEQQLCRMELESPRF